MLLDSNDKKAEFEDEEELYENDDMEVPSKYLGSGEDLITGGQRERDLSETANSEEHIGNDKIKK